MNPCHLNQPVLCCFLLFFTAVFSHSAIAESYYVDNHAGNNANSGLADFPWKNMERVNNFQFQPGDIIHFRRGRAWLGEYIALSESGDASAPIQITNYGPETDSPPIIQGAAPLSYEPRGTWDLDLHSVNAGAAKDDFAGWASSAISPNSVKADTDTYLGKGVSARLQYVRGPVPRIWRNTPMAMAPGLPISFRLRFKVEAGDLTVMVRNLTTGNYYARNGTWGPRTAAAVFPSSRFSDWSEVSLVVPNDSALGQLAFELFTNGTAYVDDVLLSLPWIKGGPNLYKRAILAQTVNGIHSVYREDTPMPKKGNVTELAKNFDWTIDPAERTLYMFYNGTPEELDAEPVLIDRGSYYAIDIRGTDVIVDGLRVEKTPVAIRARNDNILIANNTIRHANRCGILAYKLNGGNVVPMFNATTRNNVITDSSCGIYYWRVHNSLIRGNELSNIRDLGGGKDIEVMGLQSVTDSIIEHNKGSNGIIGIDLWGGPGYPAFGNVVRYNTIHDMDYTGILMGGTQDNHGVPGGPIRGYVYDNIIHHNIIYANGYGPGFETRGSGMRQNNTPREEDGPNYWYNNTLYANRFNFSGSASFAGRFVFRNNISLLPEQGHLEFPGAAAVTNDLSSADVSHNIYYPDGSMGSPLFDWHQEYDSFDQYRLATQKDIAGSLIADPALENPSTDPLIADFSPEEESPAIDAGMGVGLDRDFDGNPVTGLPDIGAYEFVDDDADDIPD